MDEEVNPYELLDLSINATEKDIKSAYRKYSLKVHPDRVSCQFKLSNIPIVTMMCSTQITQTRLESSTSSIKRMSYSLTPYGDSR